MPLCVAGGGRGGNMSDSNTKPKRVASIMTSRGCPYQCTFCSQHTVHGRKMRYFSIERTLEMVKTLINEYNINTFVIEDDLFTIDKKRTINLMKSLRKLEILNFELQVPNAFAINTLNEEVVDELSKTGIEVACLAIESGSKYVQRNIIKKNVNLEKAKQIVKFFTNRGIIVRCYFIMGFPKETKEHMRESIDYARNLGADWCTFYPVVPLVGSEMYKQFVDLNYIKDDSMFWSESAYGKRLFDTDEISAAELNDLTYLANLEINFIENKNIKIGEYRKALISISDIVRDYPFHIIGIYCMAKCYRGLKQFNLADNCYNKISELVKTDPRAKQMYEKFGFLMSDFKLGTIDVVSG